MKNTFWMVLAEGISKGSTFFITFLIAKTLGAEQFGIYSFVMSFVALFVVFTDFGLTTIMVRDVSRDHSKINDYLVNLSFLKIILGIITFLLVWIVSQFIGKNDIYITLILIYTLYSIINNFGEFIRAFFRPSEKMEFEAILKVINGISVLLIVGLAMYFLGDLVSISYAFLISGILSLIISLISVYNKISTKKFKLLGKDFYNQVLKNGLLLMSGTLFITIYISSDQLIMGLNNQIKDLGVYSLAYKITLMYCLFSGIFFQVLLPKISGSNYVDNIKENYSKYLKKIFKFNLSIFILVELITYFIGFYLKFDLGEYNKLYIILMYLFIYCLIEPLGNWSYINLISIKKEKVYLIFVLITAIINLGGNLILIPKYSYNGAIFTTILSYLVIFLLCYIYLKINLKKIKI
ncbi:MAG: flippase [Candidatus Gracilibacteria bacterium]|nr:flippase [Candidatus Gracilibacteria bacterium]